MRGRIRGLQTHKKKEDIAVPGSRTAVNISGISTEEIQRGNILAHPNQYQPVRRLDARLRLLREVSSPIKHGQEIKFFVGASETMGSLRLLGTEELIPGEEGWVQFELRDPVVAVRGDHFILRRPSPGETLGGGKIVDPHPKGRHKRFDEQIIQSLNALLQGSPAEILLEAALGSNIASLVEIVNRSRLDSAVADSSLKELLSTGSLIPLEEGQPTPSSDLLVIPHAHWRTLRDKALSLIETHHQEYPLRRGIPREELKSKLKLASRAFNAFITKLTWEEVIVENLAMIAKTGHEIQFNEQEQAKIQGLMRKFEEKPFSPPGLKECQSEAGDEIVNALIEKNTLIAVSPEVIFRKQDYDLMVDGIRIMLETNGKISLAEVRDRFKTSRKYVQALLEYLDATGFTIRDGDFRRLRKR